MKMPASSILLVFCFAAVGIPCHATETAVPRADLPSAVQKTADEQSKGATIHRVVKDDEGGQLEYEVEMVVHGHSKDVSIAPDGRLLEIEEQVRLDGLREPVQSALRRAAAKGTITKVESITKNGSIVAYEAQVRSGSRHSEIQVGPDGRPLKHEE